MKLSLLFVILLFSMNLFAGLSSSFSSFNKNSFKGVPAPAQDPVPELKYVTPKDVAPYIKNTDKYAFIDVRPPSFHKKCKLRKSINYDYGFSGRAKNTLTKAVVKKFIDQGKTVVFYCNSLKCHRSTNAAIESVINWGFPANKIQWFGKGIPGVINTFKKKYRKYVKGKGCSSYLK